MNTGSHSGAVTCYEPEQNELLVNVADRDSASLPTAETVSERTTLHIPCTTNESVTTSGAANKKLDEEMYHHVNPQQYIHERIEPVCNHYSTNDRTNNIENMDALNSGSIHPLLLQVVAFKLILITTVCRTQLIIIIRTLLQTS